MISLLAVPLPMISLHNHSTPYNGTNFTLTGVVELHTNVDTNVTVSLIWNTVNDQRNTTITSPPYVANLTFQPLATNSSGEYTFTAFIQPLNDSQFVVGNSGNTIFKLTVRGTLFLNDKIKWMLIFMLNDSLALSISDYCHGFSSSPF